MTIMMKITINIEKNVIWAALPAATAAVITATTTTITTAAAAAAADVILSWL